MRAVLWTIGIGESGVKKSLAEQRVGKRHVMILQAHQDHPELSVLRLCELFSVSRSWYYEAKLEQSDERETELRDHIERLILEFPGYGYRRVTRALARAGWKVNHKRVLRIMREESLLCHLKKRFVVVTTDSRHQFPVYPNVLADRVLTAPDQAWVADVRRFGAHEIPGKPGEGESKSPLGRWLTWR